MASTTLNSGASPEVTNPYRPGAGHMPPHLAGREPEIAEFRELLGQPTVLRNMVLTGLRGVGKTVLLETFRPLALRHGWGWIGANMSEASSISEENLAIRLLTDLSVVTGAAEVARREVALVGFKPRGRQQSIHLDYATLRAVYDATPGLAADKLRAVLDLVRAALPKLGMRGLIFAYDEAQNLSDQATDRQYPLSLLLDTFQSEQMRGAPFLLVLTGLPTLFPKLVEARTFAERMFRVLFLDRLDAAASRLAITVPLESHPGPVTFSRDSVDRIVRESGGYPYFIQFICRECFDAFLQRLEARLPPSIPVADIMRKLDSDFFAGRWARVTDRQRELMKVIASLESCDREFTVQEIVEASQRVASKPFSASHANQMLTSLAAAGLVYRNRHGRYSFAVPLMGQFIRRQP